METRIVPAPGGGVYVFFEVDASEAGVVPELKLDIGGEVVEPDAWYDDISLGIAPNGEAQIFGVPMQMGGDSAPRVDPTECALPHCLPLSASDAHMWTEAGLVKVKVEE